MTGFTSWLRSITCLGPPKDRWEKRSALDQDCIPVRLKISVRNRQQFEIKLVYNLNPWLKEQRYSCEVFVFFSQELASGDLGFYHNLWTNVRLHTPKALLGSLAESGPNTHLGQISSAIQALLAELPPWVSATASAKLRVDPREPEKNLAPDRRREKVVEELVARLLRILRLHCCSFRRSLRHSTKELHGKLKANGKGGGDQSAGLPPGAARTQLEDIAGDTAVLVHQTVDAIAEAGKVCGRCAGEGMPPECRETWALCHEFLLSEGQRALMKLLWDIQDSSASAWQLNCDPFQEDGVIDIRLDEDNSDVATPGISAAEASRVRQEGLNGGAGIINFDQTCRLLSTAIEGFREKRRECGFSESLIYPDSKHNNEKYTNRIKVLKRNALAASSLTPRNEAPSNVLADTVGMTIAAIAMGIATFSVFAATHWAGSQYGVIYIMIVIGAYVIKDRLKEWGKRYLQPIAEWFGMEFPDTITNFEDDRGRTVGQSRQFCSTKEDTAVDKRVLEMRWQCGWVPTQRHATNPEKVLVYRKRMAVNWQSIDRQLQNVSGLDDVFRIDLHHFCRRMVPAEEVHHRLAEGGLGCPRVEKVRCARVYHLNLVVRLKSRSLPESSQKARDTSMTMQMERARLVVNQQGIVRLEQLGGQPMEKPVQHLVPSSLIPSRVSVSSLRAPFSQGDGKRELPVTDVEMARP